MSDNGYKAVCQCGHGKLDHDYWGAGPCTVLGCGCQQFAESGTSDDCESEETGAV